MPFARIGDLEFCYERAGAGPPLIYISGTNGDLRVRPNILDGPLPAHFDVIAYDQRNLGRSSKPDAACTMADYADDAAAMIAFAGWDRANVIGVSFGGMVAQELAIRHPGRVRRLVLACSSPGGAGGASFPIHTLAGLAPEERARRQITIMDRRRDAAWMAAHPEECAALVAAFADPFAGETGRAAGETGRAAGARRQLEARAGHDTWDRLDRIACPTLIAGGRYDDQAPPDRQEAMAGRIRGATLRLFEGGHRFLQDDPAALPAVIAFLEEE
ncbi:MAG TPA: alpha/beta hydrolase [Hyphomicrobiales bacterium]|nr:alpha/beta hydrolase [Hyphomicrobiales bacterium]